MAKSGAWTGRVFIATSLDGFIARADGDIGWLTDPPQGRDHAKSDSSNRAESWDTFFPSVDHLVMGRGTYDKVASFDQWPYEGKSVIVVSSTMSQADSRVTVARSIDDAVAVLDAQAKSVYVDGGRVIQSFLRAGLIDEITITRCPVLLGGGHSAVRHPRPRGPSHPSGQSCGRRGHGACHVPCNACHRGQLTRTRPAGTLWGALSAAP